MPLPSGSRAGRYLVFAMNIFFANKLPMARVRGAEAGENTAAHGLHTPEHLDKKAGPKRAVVVSSSLSELVPSLFAVFSVS